MGDFREEMKPVEKETLEKEQLNTMKFINSIDRVIAQKWYAL